MKVPHLSAPSGIRFPSRVIAAAAAGIVLATVLVVGYRMTTVSHIDMVRVAGNAQVIGSNTLYGTSMLWGVTDREKQLQDANPHIEKLVLVRKWPDTLVLMTVARKPVAWIQADAGVMTVDTNGYVLRRERDESATRSAELTQISLFQRLAFDQYQVGDRLTINQLHSALAILEYLTQREALAVKHIAIGSANVIRCSVEDAEIIFAADKDVQVQGYVLHQLLEQFTRSGRTYRTIDLRFDKPVVVF